MARTGWFVGYERVAYGKVQGHDSKMFKSQAEAKAFAQKKHRNKRITRQPHYATEETHGFRMGGR